MTLSTLDVTNAETYGSIGTILGIAGTYATWPSQTQADADRIIRAGRRKFFMAANWRFLEQYYPIVTSPVSTVVGVCANGVITVTSGSIPSSMTGNYKVYPQTDGGLYDVSAQGASSITLVDTSAANDFVSQTISLYKYRYALPANFAAFLDPIVIENWSSSTQLSEYGSLPEFQIRGALNSVNTVTGPPEAFAITHDVASETGIFSPYILMYPLMENAYTLKTKIRIQPGDALAEVGSVMNGIVAECLLAAILWQAELMYGKPQSHKDVFEAFLPLAIKVDKQMKGTRQMLPRANNMTEAQLDRIAIRLASVDLTNAII